MEAPVQDDDVLRTCAVRLPRDGPGDGGVLDEPGDDDVLAGCRLAPRRTASSA